MFSIVIPYFNTELNILLRAITSLVHSSKLIGINEYEIILVDDGSNSNFQKKLHSLFLDVDIKYFKLPVNRGRSFARNFGVKNSNFQHILFLDSDDIVLPNYFKDLIHFKYLMDENINILTFSYKINNLNVFRIFNPLKFANVSYAEYKFFCTNSIMLKRTLFDQFMFDEKLHFGEDIKLWSQILSQFNFTHINIPITKYNFDYKGYGNNYEKFKFHKILKYMKYFIKFELLGRLLKSKMISNVSA